MQCIGKEDGDDKGIEDPNKCKLGTVRLRHSDRNLLLRWEAALKRACLPYSSKRPRRLLVFVNPYGGKGTAPKIYRERAAPVFEAAGIECNVIQVY